MSSPSPSENKPAVVTGARGCSGYEYVLPLLKIEKNQSISVHSPDDDDAARERVQVAAYLERAKAFALQQMELNAKALGEEQADDDAAKDWERRFDRYRESLADLNRRYAKPVVQLQPPPITSQPEADSACTDCTRLRSLSHFNRWLQLGGMRNASLSQVQEAYAKSQSLTCPRHTLQEGVFDQ